jgi:outer membrane protein TolC
VAKPEAPTHLSRWYTSPSSAAANAATSTDSQLTLAKAEEPNPNTTVNKNPEPKPPEKADAKPSSQAQTSPPLPPAYAQLQTCPIDLPTVFRLVDANSPAVGFARARVAEAQARLDRAEVQWLPNLSFGSAYNRFDGQTQNQRGEVFGVSRANLFYGGGVALTLDVSEALYAPLIARRLRSAAQLQAAAVGLGSEQEAGLAYLDLLQVHAQLEVNADTLRRAEEMLKAAESAREAKLDRSAGDVNRARTEVLFRRTERYDLQSRAAAVSARLARLLYLQPNVQLVPAESAVVPVTLVDPSQSIDDLLTTATINRPDLAAGREAIAAAWQRVRQAEREPFIPKVSLQNQTGSFGGGLNDDLARFGARNALSVQLFWEVRNLGLGNRAGIAERRAVTEQARYQLADAQARAAAEVVEAAQTAAVKFAALAPAEEAVKEATELYRIAKEGTLNVVDAKNLFDALRPLQAIQALNTARTNYLTAVIDHNRAQLRLLAATGIPWPAERSERVSNSAHRLTVPGSRLNTPVPLGEGNGG